MADLIDNNKVFPTAVHEIGIDEPVMGGPNGNDNVPHKQLADRTAWLKAQVDALKASGFVDATAITAAINAHLAAADPHPQYTTQAEVDAAIAAQTLQPLLTNADVLATAKNAMNVDANTITTSGFYNGYGTNWPLTGAANWQYMTVLRHSNGTVLWCHQRVYDFYSVKTFERRAEGGVWQPWVETTVSNVADIITLIRNHAPAAPVQSVAGKVGAVTLAPGDVGAEPANSNIQGHIAAPHQPLLTNADALSSALYKPAVDANTLINSGFYNGYGTNWPMANWQYMTVVRHTAASSIWCVQTVNDFFTDKTWQRRCVAGVWSVWVETSGYNSAGAVIALAHSTVPAGFFECSGAAISRTVYADLFTAIGISYGVGDGMTTFNLPDLRGEFVRGWSHGRAVDAGRALGSWQVDDFKSHTHTQLFKSTTGGSSAGGDPNNIVNNTINTGATGGTETRPRNVAMMYCIKY